MTPGEIMLHERGKVIGIVGDDGRLYTHNMDLDEDEARRFSVIDEVPEHLTGLLAAARRRARRQARYGEVG